ncbi:MAG: trigger factor [Endomicrobium sp.]|jgi:trigger factor|nr:trigger factor [Endomicrobium sp.]
MVQENKIIDFKSTVVDEKLCSITVDVEVPENIATDEIKSAFDWIQQQVKIDGFRHGKVPMDIVKQKFVGEAKDRAVENIIKKTVLNALKKEKFASIDVPVVEEFNYELGQTLKYRFTAERHPKIDIKDYKGIPVKKEVFKVTSKNLEQSLEFLREKNAKLVSSKSGEVAEKSFVYVDYNAFAADGKALPEITAKNHILDLSSSNIVKGFKKALKGSKIGDEKDVKVEYPADYPNKTLAGKTVTFKTKVLEIKEKELPELNDDFAKDIETENLEDLKTKLRESMEAKEKHRQDIDVEKQIVDYLLEKNKFEVPQCLIAKYRESLIEKMKSYMKSQGASAEYVEEQIELEKEKLKEEAERKVRLSYILDTICTNENLAVNDADIEEEKNKMKTSNPGKENVVDKYFTEKKESVMLSLKEQKLFKFLLGSADVKTEEKDMPLEKDWDEK